MARRVIRAHRVTGRLVGFCIHPSSTEVPVVAGHREHEADDDHGVAVDAALESELGSVEASIATYLASSDDLRRDLLVTLERLDRVSTTATPTKAVSWARGAFGYADKGAVIGRPLASTAEEVPGRSSGLMLLDQGGRNGEGHGTDCRSMAELRDASEAVSVAAAWNHHRSDARRRLGRATTSIAAILRWTRLTACSGRIMTRNSTMRPSSLQRMMSTPLTILPLHRGLSSRTAVSSPSTVLVYVNRLRALSAAPGRPLRLIVSGESLTRRLQIEAGDLLAPLGRVHDRRVEDDVVVEGDVRATGQLTEQVGVPLCDNSLPIIGSPSFVRRAEGAGHWCPL